MPQRQFRSLIVSLMAVFMLVGAWVFAAGPGTPARTIPYRGHVELGGAPIGGTTVMVFELFDDEDPNNSSLTWNETHPINPVAGDFAVVLGNLTPIPDAAFDAAALFLRISVDGTQLSGLQPINPVWAAHRSGSAYDQNVTNDLNVSGTAYVGGDTLLDGQLNVSSALVVSAPATLKSGADGVRVDGSTVSAVSDAASAPLRLEAKGAEPVLTNALLTENVAGNDSTYETATRWTIVADFDPSAPNQTSRNVSLDNTRLYRYCGDVDGCMVRLIMRNWTALPLDQTDASAGPFHFYIGPGGRWRISHQNTPSNPDISYNPQTGTDGDNSTAHIARAWNCYFTDGTYTTPNAGTNNDASAGLSLLNYTSNASYRPRCVLVIDD